MLYHRRSALKRLPGLALGLALLAGAGRAADNKTVMLPAFAYPEALPALLAAAKKAGVAVDTKERPPMPRLAHAGDAMTFLISLRNGDDLKQWVLVAETSDLTDKEAQLPPLKGFHAFSSTGYELNLGGNRTAIEMTLLGPVHKREADKGAVTPEAKHRRLLVNADYLAIGFDAACQSVIGVTAENAKRAPAVRFQPNSSSKPFPPDVVQASHAIAQQVGFTPERERAYFGSVPALLEFIKLMVKTPGLQDIMKEVIDVSWWSVLSSGGKAKSHVRIVGGLARKLNEDRPGPVEQYLFPFVLELNDKPAMASFLVVTKPNAPFATTGGVIGIQAGLPYDKDPQLTVRLIGTRCRDAVAPPVGGAPETKD